MHHHTDRIAHTTVFITPTVEYWREREISQLVHHEGSIHSTMREHSYHGATSHSSHTIEPAQHKANVRLLSNKGCSVHPTLNPRLTSALVITLTANTSPISPITTEPPEVSIVRQPAQAPGTRSPFNQFSGDGLKLQPALCSRRANYNDCLPTLELNGERIWISRPPTHPHPPPPPHPLF